MGATIIGISHHHKEKGPYGLYNENGLCYKDLYEHYYVQNNGNFLDFEKGQIIKDEDFWKMEADILVPAALENAIDEKRAQEIQVKLVVEAANGPLTSSADDILLKRNIEISPDILTNSGGVIVSYLEWVQNLSGYYWSEKQVLDKLERSLVDAFTNIWTLKEKYNTSTRQAAYLHSIEKIAQAMKLRGWY